jgi:hypothetical protein
MKTIRTLAVLLALTALNAQARIGETLEQCTVRYGTRVNLGSTFARFNKNGFQICVWFYEGKADSIDYQKLEHDILDNPVKMSDNEIAWFRKFNGGNREWVELGDGTSQTTDGEIGSYLTPQKNDLAIMTMERVRRGTAERKAKEENALKGF